jgi:hypothetical protein
MVASGTIGGLVNTEGAPMKRALILAVPLVLAVAACGDDDDDESPDTSATITETITETTLATEITSTDDTVDDDATEDTDDSLLPGGTLLPGGSVLPGGTILPGGTVLPGGSLPIEAQDVIRRIFPNLDDDQVSCLAENLGTDTDPSDVLALLDECNIQVSDLGQG